MNVLVSLCNRLLSEGVNSLLLENGYHGVVAADNSPIPDDFIPDIILVDVNSARRDLVRSYPDAKILLMDTGADQEKIATALLSFPIHGVLSMDTELPRFKKALQAVTDGQIWVDDKMLRAFLDQSATVRAHPRGDRVTGREQEIIDHVCKGYTNREIAEKLSLSEHTVKAHLNRIFQKLNTTSRSKLITLMLQDTKAVTR